MPGKSTLQSDRRRIGGHAQACCADIVAPCVAADHMSLADPNDSLLPHGVRELVVAHLIVEHEPV